MGHWGERLSRGGQVLRVQNHPMPLAAHLQRLQSSIFTSLGVHTWPLVCTSSSSFSAPSASGCALPTLTASTAGCAFGSSPCSSGTQNFLVQDIILPSVEQRHVLQSSLNVLPGSHCWPASKASAPVTSTAAINSNDLIASLLLRGTFLCSRRSHFIHWNSSAVTILDSRSKIRTHSLALASLLFVSHLENYHPAKITHWETFPCSSRN